jgi:hypothetical protein
MSISHWGIFPGFMICKSFDGRYGAGYAAWEPCDFDTYNLYSGMQWD